MSSTSDGPVRVLVDDQEVVLDDLDAAVALVRSGRIDAGTRVSLPGSRSWQTAASIPELACHLARDPWAAWDQLDADIGGPSEETGSREPESGDTDTAEREPSPDGGPETAVPAEPLEDEPTAPTAAPLEELPVDAVRSMAPTRGGRMVVETPRRSAASPGSSGKVIAFPGGGSAAAVASLPAAAISEVQPRPAPMPLPAMELPEALPAPVPAPHASASGTRWWRVALIGGAAVTVMLITQWYITSTATAVFPPAVRTPPPATQTAAPAPSPAEVVQMRPPPPPTGEHEALETRLRAEMPDAPRDISRPGQLEDALLIELTRMHVPTTSIRAPVLTWAGRKDDVPQSAEMHIRYRSVPGELERELGAVGLVVGRYVHTYALEVPALDVVIEREGAEPRQLAIDPAAAQRFYLKRIDLDGFLESLR